jgi:hypothetical protein
MSICQTRSFMNVDLSARPGHSWMSICQTRSFMNVYLPDPVIHEYLSARLCHSWMSICQTRSFMNVYLPDPVIHECLLYSTVRLTQVSNLLSILIYLSDHASHIRQRNPCIIRSRFVVLCNTKWYIKDLITIVNGGRDSGSFV